jgi:hypothetical protein
MWMLQELVGLAGLNATPSMLDQLGVMTFTARTAQLLSGDRERRRSATGATEQLTEPCRENLELGHI